MAWASPAWASVQRNVYVRGPAGYAVGVRPSVKHAWISGSTHAFCGVRVENTSALATTGNQPRCKACVRSVAVYNQTNFRHDMEVKMREDRPRNLGRIRLMPEIHCVCGHWEQLPDALDERRRLILLHAADPDVEVALIGAHGLDELRAAYGRYFVGPGKDQESSSVG